MQQSKCGQRAAGSGVQLFGCLAVVDKATRAVTVGGGGGGNSGQMDGGQVGVRLSLMSAHRCNQVRQLPA